MKKIINEIFLRFSKKIPTPQIGLGYTNNFTLFVAVMLSAQSTDVQVNKVTRLLFKHADSTYSMLALGEDKLKQYIKSIGLYNSKARNIIASCKIMIDKFNNTLPNNFNQLMSFPGIGPKSASVLLNSLFQCPIIGVDTHVHRVSNRIKICSTNSVKETDIILNKIIPNKWKFYAHNWLVLHGRIVCRAKKPMCSVCLIHDLCESSKKFLL